ncbi:hypothetical protein S40288_11510 [Stachybotrys chartarum IBT 40288]|nr:hypothetical protein S40288_11510 [Stachybotrys chartarum IBT 40288]
MTGNNKRQASSPLDNTAGNHVTASQTPSVDNSLTRSGESAQTQQMTAVSWERNDNNGEASAADEPGLDDAFAFLKTIPDFGDEFANLSELKRAESDAGFHAQDLNPDDTEAHARITQQTMDMADPSYWSPAEPEASLSASPAENSRQPDSSEVQSTAPPQVVNTANPVSLRPDGVPPSTEPHQEVLDANPDNPEEHATMSQHMMDMADSEYWDTDDPRPPTPPSQQRYGPPFRQLDGACSPNREASISVGVGAGVGSTAWYSRRRRHRAIGKKEERPRMARNVSVDSGFYEATKESAKDGQRGRGQDCKGGVGENCGEGQDDETQSLRRMRAR